MRSKVPHQYLGSSVQSQASRSKVSPGWSMVKDKPHGHHRRIHGLFFHVAFVIQTYPFCPKYSLAHWLGTTGLVLLNLHSPFWDRCLDPGHFSKTSRMELTLPPTWKPQPYAHRPHLLACNTKPTKLQPSACTMPSRDAGPHLELKTLSVQPRPPVES